MRQELTLTRAAAAAKISYQRMLRLVMIGAVDGYQDDQGHWTVDAASLSAWIGRSHLSPDSMRAPQQ